VAVASGIITVRKNENIKNKNALNMKTRNKIFIAVGILAVAGVVYYLYTRSKNGSDTVLIENEDGSKTELTQYSLIDMIKKGEVVNIVKGKPSNDAQQLIIEQAMIQNQDIKKGDNTPNNVISKN
jgi:hypothetical protein